MTLPTGLLIAAAGLVVVVTLVRAARSHALASLRATWGEALPREHRMSEIADSHLARVAERGEPASLDDRTWNDLLLDDCFRALDRTESTLGRHALYHRLRVEHTRESLDAFEALTTRIASDPDLRDRARLALSRLRDAHGYNLWWLARPDALDLPAWYAMFPVLLVVTFIVLFVSIPDRLPLLVGTLALNLGVHLATFRQVDATGAAFRQIAPLVATGQALRAVRGADVEPLVAALGRETSRLYRLKTVSRWISGDPLMLSVHPNPLAVAMGDLTNTIYDYVNLVLPLNASGVYLGAATLRRSRTALLDMIAAIGEVDAAISVASLRATQSRWTRPHFLPPGSTATLTDAVHPLLEDAVPNSIALAPGAGVLVTGSNMSGKSTFLRTVGVTAVLAQSLHTCFAAAYEAPMLRVRSCIGRNDDLLSGKSYYLVEVEALLTLVNASNSTSPYLFLLDEMFRGTNAVERIAAGESVLTELNAAGAKPHIVIAATHDNELVDLLSSSYSACHFGDALSDDELTFDYRLRSGRATSRNAIALLRLNGAPPALVQRALASAAELDRQRTR